MKIRWLLAMAAAVAFVVLVTWLPISRRASSPASAGAGIVAASQTGNGRCGPNSKPANLDLTIKDMDGRDVSLAQFKGKVVLLNFWATWCDPCQAEIPGFVELQAQYRDRGLVIVGISVDDPIEKLKPFAREFQMNYPVLAGSDRDDVQEAYGPMYGIPVSVLISRDGRICSRFLGGANKQVFEREIKALL
ncbi:MAG: TlpA family protein disulfide reductase [Acidobacteria bacterium]|nr:TlpA family protein disulfide reductase [Acidobacteriota bacterium]